MIWTRSLAGRVAASAASGRSSSEQLQAGQAACLLKSAGRVAPRPAGAHVTHERLDDWPCTWLKRVDIICPGDGPASLYAAKDLTARLARPAALVKQERKPCRRALQAADLSLCRYPRLAAPAHGFPRGGRRGMRRANVHASSCSSAVAHRNARVAAEPTRRRKRFGNRCGARAALKLSSTVERACGAPSARSEPCRPRNAARGDRLWPRHDQKAAEMRALRWSNDRCSAASRCARFKALFLLASPLTEGAIAEIQWTHPPETILPIRLFRGP